jgi:hypothetical protein
MPGPYEITVGYDPSNILEPWSITCELHLPKQGPFPLPVTMKRAPGSTFTFVKVHFVDSSQWAGADQSTNNGTTMDLQELSALETKSRYRVEILYNGKKVKSPMQLCSRGNGQTKEPPMIIND